MRWLALLAVVSGCGACGEGGIVVTHLAGAPSAVRAVSFASAGELLAIGGDNTFGLASLQTAEGRYDEGLHTSAWTTIADVPRFSGNAQLVGPFALTATQLFAREAGDWTAHTIPTNVTDGSAFAARHGTTVYGVELGTDGDGAVMRWMLEENRWREVEGTRPVGIDARDFRVIDEDTIVWTSTSTGVVSVTGGVRTTLVDCREERFGRCELGLELVAAESGSVTVTLCPTASFVIAAGTVSEFALPPGTTRCRAGRATDTTYFPLSVFAPDDSDGGVYWLGGAGWEPISAADPRMHYVSNVEATWLGFVPNPVGDVPRGIDAIVL